MTRNTQKRVEIGAPILNEDLRKFIMEYLDNQFIDTVNAKELKADGKYYKIDSDEVFDSHDYQMYYDPDYLVRVYFEERKAINPVGIQGQESIKE